jgi:hypothetical protein
MFVGILFFSNQVVEFRFRLQNGLGELRVVEVERAIFIGYPPKVLCD